MNPTTIQQFVAIAVSIATLLGGLYVVVTRPIMQIVKLEMDKLRLEMTGLRSDVKAELAAMELRLNDRIDARLAKR